MQCCRLAHVRDERVAKGGDAPCPNSYGNLGQFPAMACNSRATAADRLTFKCSYAVWAPAAHDIGTTLGLAPLRNLEQYMRSTTNIGTPGAIHGF